MHFSASALAIIVALTTVVSASPHARHEPPSHETKTQCWTMMGPKSKKHVLTSYTTTRTPCSVTVTATTTTTTTLVPITGTVTVTDTSTVSTDSTSTVPAPATFLPVQITLPEGEYTGTGGPDPVDKRDIDVLGIDTRDDSGVSVSGGPTGGVHDMPKYPSRVTCKKWAPQPKCTTTTTTVTSTSTVTPAESFSTTTTTTTSTLITSSTTVYAACATNNFIDAFVEDGVQYGISNIIPLPDGGAYPAYESEAGADSAYNCCVFGLTGPDAGIIFAYNPNDGSCIIGAYDSATCPTTGQATNQAEAIGDASTFFVTGNLPCGEIISAD